VSIALVGGLPVPFEARPSWNQFQGRIADPITAALLIPAGHILIFAVPA